MHSTDFFGGQRSYLGQLLDPSLWLQAVSRSSQEQPSVWAVHPSRTTVCSVGRHLQCNLASHSIQAISSPGVVQLNCSAHIQEVMIPHQCGVQLWHAVTLLEVSCKRDRFTPAAVVQRLLDNNSMYGRLADVAVCDRCIT